MAFLSRREVEHEIGQTVGLPNAKVSEVFNALFELACQEVDEGFLLPGFGELRITRGKSTQGTNPFTGEPVVFQGPKEVMLAVDSSAEELLLSRKGVPAKHNQDSPEVLPPLPEVRLVLNEHDWAQNSLPRLNPGATNNKIGGAADWVQADETPTCCGVSTRFCGQLDLAHVNGPEMLYVFFCDQCYSPSVVYQCS